MNILLWIVQLLLAAVFVFHGRIYVFPPPETAELIRSLDLPPWFRIFIGVSEWCAAAGLILPGLTRVATWLTPLAAAGLMVVMASAVVFHLMRGESVGGNVVLFVLATFVAYMRWRVRPIPARLRA